MFNKLISNFFKSSNELNNDYTNLLSNKEYEQLKVFDKLDRFNEVYEKLKTKDEKFRKKDALWTIYNELRLEYEYKFDRHLNNRRIGRLKQIITHTKTSKKKYKEEFDV